MEHISAKPLQKISHRDVNSGDPIWQPLKLNNKPFVFEMEVGMASPDNFCSKGT